jgi:hypothetical protein
VRIQPPIPGSKSPGTAIAPDVRSEARGPLGGGKEALVAREQRFTDKGCYGCHTVGVPGTPIAPDLRRVGARYSEAMLARWLRDPSAQEPTRHMPNLDISESEASALAAYLSSLR